MQKHLNGGYIVIGKQMFMYQMTHYEKGVNKAHLTLYKNPADFRSRKPLKQITVDEWL